MQAAAFTADGLIDAMAAIHSVDLKSVGLDDLASHKPYAPRQLRRWTGQWDKTKTRELPALDELTQIQNLGGGFYPFQRI